MKDQLIMLIAVVILSVFGTFIVYEISQDIKAPKGIIEAPCEVEYYKQRARQYRLIVCKGEGFTLYDDSGFQGDSLRKIRIEVLENEL